jgi:GT2 family glycosyltransferase
MGGFDPRFFFYWEEADLCMRLQQHGWKVVFEPRAQAVHLGGASSSSPVLRRQFFKSLYRFYRKHFRTDQLVLTRAMGRVMALFKAARAGVAAVAPGALAADRSAQKSEARSWLSVVRL